MRYLFVVSLVLSISLLVSACADPNVTPISMRYGDSDTLVMGGNLRMVTERNRPVPGGGQMPVMCTEPSPDVAIAFGKTLAVQATVTPPSGTSGSGSLNAASTEVATQLDGRTAGVLALRDGLYAACQAYTNGVLGHDAYALILSQYGNLLVALTGTTKDSTSTTFTQQDAAAAALLVDCISEYDPTRLGAVSSSGLRETNPLLSRALCTSLLSSIARGKPIQPAKLTAPKKVADATPVLGSSPGAGMTGAVVPAPDPNPPAAAKPTPAPGTPHN